MNDLLLRIAVPTPLYRSFDYLPPPGTDTASLAPGQRVRIPFGRRNIIGVLLEVTRESSVAADRLRRAQAVIDHEPVIATDVMAMLQWASGYYQCPIGEAMAAALPALLRRGDDAHVAGVTMWRLTDAGHAVDPDTLAHAKRQLSVINQLQGSPGGLERSDINVPLRVLHTLRDKGWIESHSEQAVTCTIPETTANGTAHILNPAQQQAVTGMLASADGFQPWLLEGVTGSGKTEVYLQLIEQLLARQRQVLVLVPEIGLTPQLVTRFRRRFAAPLALLHSGLNERERLTAWQQARDGSAAIVIGTRSAIFTPLANPGLLIVDEEHDASLKQQDGFRYSARDLAVWRARYLDIPVILGSATPSLESLYNVAQERYRHSTLPERTGGARLPACRILDIRPQPLEDGLSYPLIEAMRQHLSAQGQVLLFLNRRGYAPTLMCYDCDWTAECRRCDARMTWHQSDQRLHCHHCGSQRPVDVSCPRCGSRELHPVGQGTERVEQVLAKRFPEIERIRIDRDTTRRKGALDSLLRRARNGNQQLLLGTQMLAKGHHFPNVTLAAILDADHGLFSTDFRASERMAQLIVQVAGRAGRHERPGEVIIQTAHPEHPLLQLLVTRGYPAFAEAALSERQAAGLPPFARIALLRAEAADAQAPLDFLEEIRLHISNIGHDGLEIWGPVPAAMERRAGRYRAQLLLQAQQHGLLQQILSPLVRRLESHTSSRRVRWSVDVDPADTF